MLDNEAAQALADTSHVKHRALLATLEAIAGRNERRPASAAMIVPTAVRVEALLNRRRPGSAGLGQFRVRDVELTSQRADRAVELRRAASGSEVDATVAQAAEELATPGVRVSVYTADLTDLPRLAAATRAPRQIVVRPL